MDSNAFFDVVVEHWKKQLPFVVYRHPRSTKINGRLQKSDALNSSDDFSESGFIFAPFDLRRKIILMPDSDTVFLQTRLEDVPLKSVDKTRKGAAVSDGDRSKDNHVDLVQRGLSAIEKGYLKKVVLSRYENIGTNMEPLAIFKGLSSTYQNAFVYCWYHPNVGLWLGATPETFLQIDGNRLTTMALAGTREVKNMEQTPWTNKEIEEQQIVTDSILESLSQYAGSIHASKVRTIQAGKLYHLCTDISAELESGIPGFKEALLSLHPTPAVCGYPSEEAQEFILDNEGYDREYYTGFLGELHKADPNGDTKKSHLYVNLRCLQMIENNARVYVGGGITRDSIPEQEWEETVAKSMTLKNII